MAIRLNSNSNPWTTEHPTYQDMNDTNDYLEDNVAFIYPEEVSLSTSSTTEVTARTYTFSKDVDGVMVIIRTNVSSGGTGYAYLYKNTTQLVDADVQIGSGMYESGLFRYWSSTNDAIATYGNASTTHLGLTLYLNTSFTAGDDLVIKHKAASGYTHYIYEVVIIGYKNKDTDNSWVTAS